MRSTDDVISEAIAESIQVQKETRELLKEGKIDQKEADHRIGNAEQVILFAQNAAARLNTPAVNPS